tara:strand:- start:272 stop:451 length:180 start_codon:yes stop_codon:yes gene_type:complete
MEYFETPHTLELELTEEEKNTLRTLTDREIKIRVDFANFYRGVKERKKERKKEKKREMK